MTERVVQEFIQLVKIDSPSRGERELADYLKTKCQKLGLTLTEDAAGTKVSGTTGNLHGVLPGEGEPLLLCAHMDTVRSNRGVEVVLEDGVLKTKGETHILGADDKAGIAAILELLQVLKEQREPHPPIEVLFTIGEEVGLLGAKYLNPADLVSKSGYVLDSSGPVGSVVTRSPVHNAFVIKMYGRAAHAGNNPEEGVNAIQIASRIVAGLSLGRVDEYTTANIGRITGGDADNIVPDYAELSGEVRSHEPERLLRYKENLQKVVKDVAAIHGGRAEVEFAESFPALRLSEDHKVVRVARKAAKQAGLVSALVATGGGSDANILNGKGITCANLGIGAGGEHSPREYIAVDSLVSLVKFLLQIVKEW
ncbi:MAG: M20/M25/M40 family metallo-hydrolase [Firmicutes bacterium]|nr:M20/M25/M40 family metallo-hydrolase [Bacillota bacterium]